jgi:hypothetical protein
VALFIFLLLVPLAICHVVELIIYVVELSVVGWGFQGKLNVVGEICWFACVLECMFV